MASARGREIGVVTRVRVRMSDAPLKMPVGDAASEEFRTRGLDLMQEVIAMSEGAGWRFILNSGITGRVLCWDESAGSMALSLAGMAREVFVVHPDPGTLRTIQQVLAAKSVANVSCAQAWADGHRLPFSDGHFDGFVMSGVNRASVLRAVAESQGIESALRALFAEVYRVLKPGGFACASQQNRFGYDRIAGCFKSGDDSDRHVQADDLIPFRSIKRAAGKSGN